IHAAPGSSVTEIAAATGVTANTVSQSLAALSGAHVVAVQRDGRFRRWSLSDEAAHQVLHHMKAPHSVLHPEH
ncbi:MAG: helix-turn-helix domain-containing protein, partial [Lapillicoccus sp.]